MELKFYRCSICGQIIAVIQETGANIVCCGQNMEEIKANTVDASLEKHVPVFEQKGNKVHVRVGSKDHPMEEAHYIQWILLKTENGCQMRALKPGDSPKACFYVGENDKIKAVYAYCNVHGLWKA